MKKRALVLSLICCFSIIFLGAPTLAQKADKTWEDEEVAPPTSGGGRWAWTSQRLIQPEDLLPLSLGELEIMRNEIYARHGWIFRRADLRNYFQSQPWYRPRSDNAYYSNQQVEAELNPIERRNLQIILSREHALGR